MRLVTASDEPRWAIRGRVVDRAGRGVGGLRVEVLDRDTRWDDLLDVATTDDAGRFTATFDRERFGDDRGRDLPDVHFRVLHGRVLLTDTRDDVRTDLAPGRHDVTLPIDATALPDHEVPGTGTPSSSTEVRIDELGEALAAALATAQRELARYPSALGAFVVEETDVTIPVRMRVDDLGQVMATVVPDATAADVGTVRMKIRSVLGASEPPPVVADQPLERLASLDVDTRAQLRAHRIFTVDDLARVGRNAAGREALGQIVDGPALDEALRAAGILRTPGIPAPVAEALVDARVGGVDAFVERDPAQLAEELGRRLPDAITADHVMAWQEEVRRVLRVPLPDARAVEPSTDPDRR